MLALLLQFIFVCRASSFVVPAKLNLLRLSTPLQGSASETKCTWSPQDLTKDVHNFDPIPEDDYIKRYQEKPELWPVEFFLIVYRRERNKRTRRIHTQVLVRESANGTSKYGVGSGCPVTRWLLSTQELPRGYKWSEPPITFEASSFPEFRANEQAPSWTYKKIEILENAFNTVDVEDSELTDFSKEIRDLLQLRLLDLTDKSKEISPWERSRISVVQKAIENPNSVAAIQGTLRMSGMFDHKKTNRGTAMSHRYLELGKDGPDAAEIVNSMQIHTMFPQMPEPMPPPLTTPEELREEIMTRHSRMEENGRNPHIDKYGRKFTHISTSNVSNTIHGVYFTLDVTGLPGLDEVPALDVFGSNRIKREWKSLSELKVLDPSGEILSNEDPKPTFISGYIVRQLVKDGIIDTHKECIQANNIH